MCFTVVRKASCLTLATVHLVHSGLIDDWLCGSNIESTKALRLRIFIESSMRQPLTTTDSLLMLTGLIALSAYRPP